MKLCIKKIYCASCQKLVKGSEQILDKQVKVYCSKCGNPIWVWNGIGWRYLGKST